MYLQDYPNSETVLEHARGYRNLTITPFYDTDNYPANSLEDLDVPIVNLFCGYSTVDLSVLGENKYVELIRFVSHRFNPTVLQCAAQLPNLKEFRILSENPHTSKYYETFKVLDSGNFKLTTFDHYFKVASQRLGGDFHRQSVDLTIASNDLWPIAYHTSFDTPRCTYNFNLPDTILKYVENIYLSGVDGGTHIEALDELEYLEGLALEDTTLPLDLTVRFPKINPRFVVTATETVVGLERLLTWSNLKDVTVTHLVADKWSNVLNTLKSRGVSVQIYPDFDAMEDVSYYTDITDELPSRTV